MSANNIHTLSILVANKPGVLVRVALVFARRGYNIDSLVVSPSHNHKFSRMTITAKGDPTILEQIIKQVDKLVDVIHASEHTTDNAVDLEMALLKVRAAGPAKTVVLKQMKAFSARLIDDSEGLMIIAVTDSTDRLDMFEGIMSKYGLVEMVRTGKLLMMKGKETT